MAATLRTTADYTPTFFKAKGKSYRFVNVDSEVRIDGGTARVRDGRDESQVPLTAPYFLVDGYAPFAAQMLLLRYWKQHGQPRIVHTVPGMPINDVIVEPRGREAVRVAGKALTLDRYVVDG